MAMEPIGSVMSLQMQSITQVEPVKPAAQSMDAAAQETGAQLDQTTAAVARVQGKDTNADSGSQNSNQETYANQAMQASREQIKEAVDKMNKKMENSEAVFGIHEGTNRITIKIVDKDSKKVIKELPPEKTLDMIAKVWEMAGILVDEKR